MGWQAIPRERPPEPDPAKPADELPYPPPITPQRKRKAAPKPAAAPKPKPAPAAKPAPKPATARKPGK